MCLTVNTRMTEELRAGPVELEAWKILYMGEGLESWFRFFTWQAGVNQAEPDKDRVTDPVTYGFVYGGAIHVYLDEADARRAKEKLGTSFSRLVKVRCRRKHLEAAGWFDGARCACYTEVWLDEDEYRKAVGEEVTECA